MNIYSVLPSELWIEVLMNLNCKDILTISDILSQFKFLIENNNIFEKRKYLGFPRPEGSAYVHDMSKLDNVLEISKIDKSCLNLTILLDDLLDRLYVLNLKLIRGDLIIFDYHDNNYYDNAYIFDGNKIIEFDQELLSLPKEFEVINNNVPLLYWTDLNTKTHNMAIPEYVNFIWFNIELIRDELFNNIDFDSEMFTHFVFNGRKHKIFANFWYGEPEGGELSDFNHIFKSAKLLLLSLYEYNTDGITLELDLHDNYYELLKR